MRQSERDQLRALQDKWLALPVVQNHIRTHGDHTLIFGFYATEGPSYRDVQKMLYPELREWFADELDGR